MGAGALALLGLVGPLHCASRIPGRPAHRFMHTPSTAYAQAPRRTFVRVLRSRGRTCPRRSRSPCYARPAGAFGPLRTTDFHRPLLGRRSFPRPRDRRRSRAFLAAHPRRVADRRVGRHVAALPRGARRTPPRRRRRSSSPPRTRAGRGSPSASAACCRPPPGACSAPRPRSGSSGPTTPSRRPRRRRRRPARCGRRPTSPSTRASRSTSS